MSLPDRDFILKNESIARVNTLFFRQFAALFWKNYIVLSKHKLLNLLRCALLPIGYGIFLSIAQIFLNAPNNYGLGAPAPINDFTTQFDGSLVLIWADGTNGAGNPSASAMMAHIASGFNDLQYGAVQQVSNSADIPSKCPQNLNGNSHCYAAVTFNYLPVSSEDTTPINYTITADQGLTYVNVHSHMGNIETRILPLQLAIDRAFIALRAGLSIPTPLEWPYTQETNQRQATTTRLGYIKGMNTILVIAHFICYVGIAYQLSGAFARERADLLTSHMQAMGLLDSARIISWHLSLSLAYLPAWIIVAIVWHQKIFSETSGGLIVVIHLLLGLSLASWSFFVAAPFGKIPQIAAIASPVFAILFAILALLFSRASTVTATIFTLLFPPGYYIFTIRAIGGYENHLRPTNLIKPDPDNHLILLPIMVACVANIFLWPYLGMLVERRMYEPSSGFWTCFRGRKQREPPLHPEGTAISIRNLSKTFAPSMFSREKGSVTAILDLSMSIPKTGIFVLLGSNGSGTSTVLSIIADLLGRTSGFLTFEGGVKRPPRGVLGIVPQKNVLFPDLTCYQTLRVWHAVKYSSHPASKDDDHEELLRRCDLGEKIHSNAGTLSGGQKRKLQLAIGLVGGSKIVLVDECTSGIDPLSRRALWRTLTSVKHERTILFVTHLPDEADILADHVAILASPGKLVAEGSPVALKTNLGHGYSIRVTFDLGEMNGGNPTNLSIFSDVLDRVWEFAPLCTLSRLSPSRVIYQLRSKDPGVVEKILQVLDDEAEIYNITSVDVLGTSIEDIFLDLMESEVHSYAQTTNNKKSTDRTEYQSTPGASGHFRESPGSSRLILADGRPRSPLSQARTIFYKRMLIARRSWLTPVFTVLFGVCGACVPLLFLSGESSSCTVTSNDEPATPLYFPTRDSTSILTSPRNITAILGPYTSMETVPDNATFVSTIQQDYLKIPIGGISIDLQTGESLVAWRADAGLPGPILLNLVTNILYNYALNASGDTAGVPSVIAANYANFPSAANPVLADLKWVAFFGAAMAVYPAFFSLYVSRERQSSVQAMQSSNGLSDPIGLWLGHLLWDSIFGIVIATTVVVVYVSVSERFYGLGLLWIVLAQYSFVGALLSYCVSLFTSSPITAFAVTAGYQIVMFILYLVGNLLTLPYAKILPQNWITITHVTLSVLSPVVSVARSAFVSINLFSLLCNGSTVSFLSNFVRYGSPMPYLFVQGLLLFCVLVWSHTGFTVLSRLLSKHKRQAQVDTNLAANRRDVAWEARTIARSIDTLRVLHVTKSYCGKSVVDDVSFGVSRGDIFALLGPNGAGKTMTFDMIRGEVVPDTGDVKIRGVSVVDSPRDARLALGVCPQFTAIDGQLTVREHLLIYGRLKGLARGPALNKDVDTLMLATSLNMYADRSASQLSCGNQRKLSLAIALMGNPPVLLIDEFSTGIDAKTKREMWETLRKVSAGKAVVLVTHLIEEASALATKVGIMSKRMLAIGTIEELAARHAAYQVQFSCHTRRDVLRAQVLMSHVPGARLVDDVATRFQVPIRERGRGNEGARASNDGGTTMTLAQLFGYLASQGEFAEYTVERATLENAFVKVVLEEEDEVVVDEGATRRRRRSSSGSGLGLGLGCWGSRAAGVGSAGQTRARTNLDRLGTVGRRRQVVGSGMSAGVREEWTGGS